MGTTRLVLVVFGQEFVATDKEIEDGEICLGKNFNLKNLGISRYLEIQYKLKTKNEFKFDNLIAGKT